MTRYVALLRGINVGGNNLIKMVELKACFEEEGFGAVRTYIQSGNVLFDAPALGRAKLTRRVEAAIEKAFAVNAAAVVRSRKDLEEVVASAPAGFGKRSGYRYDVIFLKEPLKAAAALRDVPIREGVDQASAGKGVLYFSRLDERASQSRLSKIVGLPMYKNITIRNWNTTTKVLRLMQAAPEQQQS